MALTARYPSHPPAEVASFGMDFSPIVPAGMTLASGSLAIFKNSNPPVAGGADWNLTRQPYLRGRSVFQILSGGVVGTDYLLEWTVTDNRGGTWVRSAAVLCGPAS